MSEEQSVLCFVSGRVQGVFFRASTAEQAAARGLRGHARNLPDGRVEVLLHGSSAAVGDMIDWLWQGPRRAEVTGVAVQEYEGAAPSGFSVG